MRCNAGVSGRYADPRPIRRPMSPTSMASRIGSSCKSCFSWKQAGLVDSTQVHRGVTRSPATHPRFRSTISSGWWTHPSDRTARREPLPGRKILPNHHASPRLNSNSPLMFWVFGLSGKGWSRPNKPSSSKRLLQTYWTRVKGYSTSIDNLQVSQPITCRTVAQLLCRLTKPTASAEGLWNPGGIMPDLIVPHGGVAEPVNRTIAAIDHSSNSIPRIRCRSVHTLSDCRWRIVAAHRPDGQGRVPPGS